MLRLKSTLPGFREGCHGWGPPRLLNVTPNFGGSKAEASSIRFAKLPKQFNLSWLLGLGLPGGFGRHAA